jgi:hypothetical protein
VPNPRRRLGYDYIHSLVDDCSRLAYSEVLADEQGPTCADFVRRAQVFFASHGIRFERIMTDNAWGLCALDGVPVSAGRAGQPPPAHPTLHATGQRQGGTLQPHPPGRVGVRERTAALADWMPRYNYHRAHTALGGLPPIARVNNLSGHYS